MSTHEKKRIGESDAEHGTERKEESERASRRDERRVVATAHADASPAKEDGDVRPIGNTDVPVNARDPDAP